MAAAMERGASAVIVAAPEQRHITLSWLIRTILTWTFLISFAQYEMQSSVIQFLPMALLALCSLLVLSGRHRGHRLQHLLSGGGLWFAGMLFGEAVSDTSHDTYSILYGLVFLGVFLCARLVLQEIGLANVIRAYSDAGLLVCFIILLSGRGSLFAGQGVRFTGGTRAHPNLVGFILAGFFPMVVWRAMEENRPWRKRAYVALSAATFGLIFLTGSRGSLSAVMLAGGALFLRGVARGWFRKMRVTHLLVIVVLMLLPLALAYLLANHRLEHVTDYITEYLALKTSQRGITSGMSGRTGIWKIAFRLLRNRDRWFFGFGYRAGDRMVGTIDNGYVQLVFESGLIAGGLIFGSMLRVFVLLWKASAPRENNAWTRFYMVLWCLMIVYFFNNISTRYLFSFGSPFSLCVLFMMAASREELVGSQARMHTRKAGPAPRLAPAASLGHSGD
ncbi:MAG TPA: O-antigen ligase family protein [Acidobacteriaceae bacterium]